jgi:hypothetical protein
VEARGRPRPEPTGSRHLLGDRFLRQDRFAGLTDLSHEAQLSRGPSLSNISFVGLS